MPPENDEIQPVKLSLPLVSEVCCLNVKTVTNN